MLWPSHPSWWTALDKAACAGVGVGNGREQGEGGKRGRLLFKGDQAEAAAAVGADLFSGLHRLVVLPLHRRLALLGRHRLPERQHLGLRIHIPTYSAPGSSAACRCCTFNRCSQFARKRTVQAADGLLALQA